jgi:hypothetical protein
MVIPVSLKVGIPKLVALFLYCALQSQTFQVGTGHGVSEGSYSALADPPKPGQGAGQGLAVSKTVHIITADITHKALALLQPMAVIHHSDAAVNALCKQLTVFADDTFLFISLCGLSEQ